MCKGIILFVLITTGSWQNQGEFTTMKSCKDAAFHLKLKSTEFKCLSK